MAVRSGLFLSDDGPESSFLGTKKTAEYIDILRFSLV